MRVGSDPDTGHELFVLTADGPEDLLPDLRGPSPRFVCLLVWDASAAAQAAVDRLAAWLIAAGAVHVCCWGPDCERAHDAVDAADLRKNPDSDPVVMTTWHDREPLADTVYFVLNTARPDERYTEGCTSTVAVCIGNPVWAGAVRSAFADPRGFSRRVLRASRRPAG
jgi:hypothetical protein